MTLENRLLRALGGADGPPPGAAVLLAVSGGIDSMTLLEVTAELVRRGRLEIRPVAAHLHHGIRGQDADEDQRLVEAACRRLGIALHTDRVEIPPGPSLEDRARRARRRFLADTARRFSARHVLLAHQADDQAETVLDRVLAGAGPEGLAGMRPRAVLPVDRGESLVVLRPWLEVPRSAIAHRAAAQGIAFREDRTNRETRWRRGRLRHAVMPYLREAVNPALTAAMLRLGSVMRGTAELLEAAAKDALVGVVRTPPPALAWLVDRHPEEVVALDRRAFRALAAPLQGAVLRLAMRQLDRVQPPVPGHRALGDLARRLAGGGGTGPWRVRRGLHAVMDGATALFARRPLVLRDTRAHAVIA
ncbi:MAG: tRNA lysidine(34) synthetase TilS, partial [Planctomycetes bacterium]|nr:tRNA lysidine(34) synthetase TilS [Planctomycetota bacterium]